MVSTIFLNLKRFDISFDRGGINVWPQALNGAYSGFRSHRAISSYSKETRFVAFLPEAHLIGAIQASDADVISFDPNRSTGRIRKSEGISAPLPPSGPPMR